jgi:cytochrome d ubiquinol oxidase subunit II
MHGIIFGVLKTEGDLNKRLKNWVNNAIILFVICYVTLTMVTLVYLPHVTKHFVHYPVLFIVPIFGMLSVANIPREIHHQREWRAFLSSSASIIWLMLIFAVGNYPNMVISSPNPENSLTIYNAASSPATLKTMLIIALIGMPLVLIYTISIYWVFRGKVKLDSKSY